MNERMKERKGIISWELGEEKKNEFISQGVKEKLGQTNKPNKV